MDSEASNPERPRMDLVKGASSCHFARERYRHALDDTDDRRSSELRLEAFLLERQGIVCGWFSDHRQSTTPYLSG